MTRTAFAVPTVMLLALWGCTTELGTEVDEPVVAFDEADEGTGVPAALIAAIAEVETGMQMIAGDEEFPGQVRAYGVMGLREIDLATELTGDTTEDIQNNRTTNIYAAAAVLSHWAEEEGIDIYDVAAWAPVVARYAGVDEPEAQSEYVAMVYDRLRTGIVAEGLAFEPIDVIPDFPPPHDYRTGDGSAIWTPSPNYSSRSGSSVDFVIIHTCEGSYSGCWGWQANPSSGVSAHYTVSSTGSEVRQMVDESNKAWHIAANYDCDNNSGKECWRDGTSMNRISVGIEHAGYASQSSWSSGLIDRSAKLTCGITSRHDVPRDSYHIVGHGQLQPWNRSDPGAAWPWTTYLNKVKAECGDGGSSGGDTSDGGSSSGGTTTGSAFVIDSNNSRNDTSKYKIEVSGNWWSSANVSGYYNTGYWVAPTGAVSDPASFWFKSSATTCYKVEAWWTAAYDRPTSVTFLGWDSAAREVGRKAVDQRSNGSRWNNLGTWKFPSGWNRVLLSRWAAAGNYAIADAVRLTPTGC